MAVEPLDRLLGSARWRYPWDGFGLGFVVGVKPEASLLKAPDDGLNVGSCPRRHLVADLLGL